MRFTSALRQTSTFAGTSNEPQAAIAKEGFSKDTSWIAQLVLPLTCPNQTV